MQGRGTRPAPEPRQIGRKSAVAPPAPDRAHGAYPAAEGQIPRAKRPVRPAEGFHCLATATPPCRRVHQGGSMLHSCADGRGARAHRPQLPSCKSHPARRPRPRPRYWSVGNHGRHAPTAQHHRLLGLALQAHRRPCHGNRSETTGEGRVRVQRGQLVQTIHDSRPHRAQHCAA